MTTRAAVLLGVLVVAIGAAVVLYALVPSHRPTWLLAITLGSTAAGLLLARTARRRGPGAP